MSHWTSAHVKTALADAFRTLFALPIVDQGPSSGQGFWPSALYTAEEVDEMRKEFIANGGRSRFTPSAKDISRMEFILLGRRSHTGWLHRFLADDAGAKRCLAHWAMWTASERKHKPACRYKGWAYSTFRRRAERGAEILAGKLNALGAELP